MFSCMLVILAVGVSFFVVVLDCGSVVGCVFFFVFLSAYVLLFCFWLWYLFGWFFFCLFVFGVLAFFVCVFGFCTGLFGAVFFLLVFGVESLWF